MQENSNYYDNTSRYQGRTGARMAKTPRSAMAITSLVLGILALITSAIPIINNASFFLALLGVIFGIVGLVATLRGTRAGKVLAIVALVINIAAAGIVLATQNFYSNALDEALEESLNGPSAIGTSDASGNASSDATSTDLAIGTSVKYASGLSVSVDEIQTGLINYDSSAVTGVRVTYTNEGSAEVSFNVYDWKGETAQGVQQLQTYYSEAVDELGSGTLAPGGTVSGMIYFKGDLTKVLYYSSILSNTASASWLVA